MKQSVETSMRNGVFTEVRRELCLSKIRKAVDSKTKKRDIHSCRTNMVKAAALCIAAIEDYDRRYFWRSRKKADKPSPEPSSSNNPF